MELSPSTEEFLALLDAFSGHRLSRQDDLGALFELASHPDRKGVLDKLSFQAKFISKCHGIMTRIGSNGNGYDKLMAELTTSLEEAKTLLRSLLASATSDLRVHFTSTYLGMSPESFQNLLALMYDLSWYKNWNIDGSRGME